jgi:hypothetical protein
MAALSATRLRTLPGSVPVPRAAIRTIVIASVAASLPPLRMPNARLTVSGGSKGVINSHYELPMEAPVFGQGAENAAERAKPAHVLLKNLR